MSHATPPPSRAAAQQPNRPRGHKAALADILKQHAGRRAADEGRVVSTATINRRWKILFAAFADLRDELGFKIENPRNLKQKHVLALAAHWEAKGHAPATLQNALSTLRVFAGWIGKPGLVPGSKALVSSPGKATRSGAALEDKGWDGKGIDIPALTEKIRAIDPRVALQIELQRAFGLRSEESWKLMPRYHLFQTEIGVWALNLCKGTKGGKPRIVFLTRQTQWDALERAEALAGAGSLIPPAKPKANGRTATTTCSGRPASPARTWG